ncbi:hypothetical protein Nepgr_019280 [Nepenthes gracilis]|uniref:Uncharacterized protein n=1 Tax=Nepenthes gracilis TaxID=150966 RepID=A0AAD3SV45_NEPGR|nr:hypothetical protein Nepgr_019280 [Nepenthes gracilis]
MQPRRYAFGRPEEATHPDSVRATLAEFLSTLIFVFAGEGSLLALGKMYKEVPPVLESGSLVLIALAHAFSFFAAVSASLNVSGGHVNPAVTFGALVGGRISVLRAFYYWVAQLLGAILACALLLAYGEGNLNALLLEIIMTFGLVYTVYATAIDPKRGSIGTIAPLAIALIVGANTLVGGPFDGASMNPARAFGPALVGWKWNNHWIFWVGPLVGAGLAGLIYEFVVIPTEPPHIHQPLAPEDY